MTKNIREEIKKSKLTKFEKDVLLATIDIEEGSTKTYGEIAAAIGKPKAARAVGNALNKNPLVPDVPCHRVVAKNGIGGYAYGIKKKIKMLRKEGVKIS